MKELLCRKIPGRFLFNRIEFCFELNFVFKKFILLRSGESIFILSSFELIALFNKADLSVYRTP